MWCSNNIFSLGVSNCWLVFASQWVCAPDIVKVSRLLVISVRWTPSVSGLDSGLMFEVNPLLLHEVAAPHLTATNLKQFRLRSFVWPFVQNKWTCVRQILLAIQCNDWVWIVSVPGVYHLRWEWFSAFLSLIVQVSCHQKWSLFSVHDPVLLTVL